MTKNSPTYPVGKKITKETTMKRQTIAQRKQDLTERAAAFGINLVADFRTHAQADKAEADLHDQIMELEASNSSKADNGKPQKKENKKMTKAQIIEAYEEIRTNDPELEKVYDPIPSTFTKAQAEQELQKIREDAEIEAANDKMDAADEAEPEVAETKPKKKKKKDKPEPETTGDDKIYLTEKQHALIQHFPKSGKIKALKLMEKMGLEENKIGALKLQLDGTYGLAKKECLVTTDDGSVVDGTITLTDFGMSFIGADHEPNPNPSSTSKKKAKPEFVPPHSDEEIAGAKKKKAKKMVKANDEALAEYNEKYARKVKPSENPSKYEGGIPAGRHQDRKENGSTVVGLVLRDLFEQKVGTPGAPVDDLNMGQAEFVKLAESFGINAGMARRQWGRCVKADFPYTFGDDAPAPTVDTTETKTKKKGKKKGKKGKKNQDAQA